jgi:hypothetical protein
VRGKETTELAFCVTKRDWNEPVGFPVLYSGLELITCEFAGLTQEQLVDAADSRCDRTTTLPLNLARGEILSVRLPFEADPLGSVYLRVQGNNIYAAAFIGDRILGRVLLWDKSPKMAGDANTIYLPESYRNGQKELRFLVAALGERAELGEVGLERVM